MLYEFLVTIYSVICLLLILIILVQKGKGSMGLGGLGAGTQMLFGGSGGQDLFQKITWVLATFFMLGSLVLALMKSYQPQSIGAAQRRASMTQEAPVTSELPTAPSENPQAQ